MTQSVLERWASYGPVSRVIGRQSDDLSVPSSAQSLTIATLIDQISSGPSLVVAPSAIDAERLAQELKRWLGEPRVELYPDSDTLPFERISPSTSVMGGRCKALHKLSAGELDVMVASAKSAVQVFDPNQQHAPIVIDAESEIDVSELSLSLVHMGYRRTTQVERRGDFSIRGSIVDIFASTSSSPVRIDLWGDQIDRLVRFSIADQLATTEVPRIEIYPARELSFQGPVKTKAKELLAEAPWGSEHWSRFEAGEFFDGMESWTAWIVDEPAVLADLFSDTALLVEVDSERIKDRISEIQDSEREIGDTLAKSWDVDNLSSVGPLNYRSYEDVSWEQKGRKLLVNALPTIGTGESEPNHVGVRVWPQTGEALAEALQSAAAEHNPIVIAASTTPAGIERLQRTLSNWGIDVANFSGPGIQIEENSIIQADFEKGFFTPEAGVAFICDSDLGGRRRKRTRAKLTGGAASSVEDLSKGDLVVHYTHGVGRFEGIVTKMAGGHEGDYLQLAYAGDDKLYLPTDQIDLIRHYAATDNPKLNKLGGSDFAKTKRKVQSEVAKIAQELVVLYQKRVTTTGYRFGPDTPWQKEIEDAFEYELTPDQASAIEEVKSDMETDRPMDRLVVGDVGFGKTEIALRAMFKAVQEGKQAALLAPTTLLARQHYQTFTERLAQYPIKIGVLSRFNTAAENKRLADLAAAGDLDILIGTHRLLSSDISYADLGLLVVDEEQRFGVSHKEKIKEQSHEVDVLTLSATPIPRTLELSLTGIRDLSVLNTPPLDRQPIATHVGPKDERVISEAIRRELLREGQVFYVHNRVRSIDHEAQRIRELVPEARVEIAHGQMDETRLEQIVTDFWEGNFDVLVCTTIIESGIDMPTVNTLIVDSSENLGLGQLHQLRGRVGRSGQRAYAYLLTVPDRVVPELAHRRLTTIGESTELGAGFKIAMRDLEIRGAGNLLGTGQSGHISSVGYDLYCQLVTDAIEELKGNDPTPVAPVSIDLPVDAYIPESFIVAENVRIQSYRRLSEATSADDLDKLLADWKDRFGEIPEPAKILVELAKLRVLVTDNGVKAVSYRSGPGFGGPEAFIRLQGLELPVSVQLRLKRLYPGSKVRESNENQQAFVDIGIDDPDKAKDAYEVVYSLIGIS